MNKVYYAHPYKTYGTSIEKEHIELIKSHFNNSKIINPSDIRIQTKAKLQFILSRKKFWDKEETILKNVFFPQIKKCDILVFFNKYQWGVRKEIDYANSIGIGVIDIMEIKGDN